MNETEPRLGVWSEAGRLRRVLVCAPGLAHQRLTPDTADELLFDDVIWLQQARRDHFDFVAKMVDHGVEVLDLQELLADVVAMPGARDWVLDRKITDDLVGSGLIHEIRAWLTELPPNRLAEFLIGGVAYHDVPHEVGGAFLSAFRELDRAGFVIRPLPNTQFMRDNTAWIFQGVTLNPMYWPARRQETLLTTAVYKFHPAFADEKYDVWLGDPDGVARDHGAATLEGGDVMPIGKGVVVIGMGERSSHQAITQVARNLFAAGAAERVIIASLPKTRSAMHLDTVFTFCDYDL
ncbi:MAG: arginine deiminase family protein, partial [Mycobacterium sp.]